MRQRAGPLSPPAVSVRRRLGVIEFSEAGYGAGRSVTSIARLILAQLLPSSAQGIACRRGEGKSAGSARYADVALPTPTSLLSCCLSSPGGSPAIPGWPSRWQTSSATRGYGIPQLREGLGRFMFLPGQRRRAVEVPGPAR